MTPAERRASTRPQTLKGSDYRALRRISDVENHTLTDVGETCEAIPATALPALLASGKIERAEERRAEARRKKGAR